MTTTSELEDLVGQKYRHGFVTDVESDTLPPGLDEDVVRAISRIKREPQFMLDWRLRAYRHWLGMLPPDWAHPGKSSATKPCETSGLSPVL